MQQIFRVEEFMLHSQEIVYIGYFLPIRLLGKQNALYNVINALRNDFDFILIDCPPALGNLSINALCASDRVIIPMACDYLAWKGFELLLGTLENARRIKPDLSIMRIAVEELKKSGKIQLTYICTSCYNELTN